MKYKTCSHLKRGFWSTGQQSSSFLFSPGKMPLTITVANFLDMSVWWLLMPWPQPQSIPCEVHPNSWIGCLTILIRLRFSIVGCAYFSSTLFPSTQLSVNMLGYSTLWTVSFFGNECLWLTLLVKGVNDCLLDNCQISSLPSWLCSLVNQTERPFWRLRKPLQVFWVD